MDTPFPPLSAVPTMQKSLVFASILAVSALPAVPARACAFSYPRCYFAGDVGTLRQTELGELWLVGRHFFPEWIGTAPRGNDIKSPEGHALDFATAAARAGAADARGDYERYRACAESWERAVHDRSEWLPPFVPVPEAERAAVNAQNERKGWSGMSEKGRAFISPPAATCRRCL